MLIGVDFCQHHALIFDFLDMIAVGAQTTNVVVWVMVDRRHKKLLLLVALFDECEFHLDYAVEGFAFPNQTVPP